MIEEYVPSYHQNDNVYERFMEQPTRDLNNPSTTEDHDTFPFPIEPLRSVSSTKQPKRSSMHSNESGITSPLASSRTPVLPPTIPAETSTPHPSSFQHARAELLNCQPGKISIQSNNLFVKVLPAWLEAAPNGALKSPNIIDRSQITRILSQS